jgi:ABC-type sugar transport system permease subunit
VIEAWKGMGFYMMIYLAGLQAIPSELIEAAKMDGASPWQRVRHVIIPGLRPVFAVTLTLAMLSAAQSFESIFVLTRGGPQDATLTLGYYIWQKAFEQHDMGYASAVGLVLWFIMILLSLLNLRATRSEAA